MPPAVNWTAPQKCLDKYAGMQECQFGEVGYAIMQTSNPKTSAKLIYGTAVGGCKDALNYYAIVGQGGPKALTAKACTSLNTKVRCVSECAFKLRHATSHLNFFFFHHMPAADPQVHPRDRQRHQPLRQHVHWLQRLHQPEAERPRHVRT